jgi:leader peptidase (prepilin peptidase)/N-methyltransferase
VILASPIVGSFLGVLIERLPTRRPLLWVRSECDACHHPLGPLDLIPFASWALSRGHCRHCNARLSVFYPVIELAAVLVAVWTATATTGWRFLAGCAIGWTLLVVAIIRWRKNHGTLLPALAALVWLASLYAM